MARSRMAPVTNALVRQSHALNTKRKPTNSQRAMGAVHRREAAGQLSHTESAIWNQVQLDADAVGDTLGPRSRQYVRYAITDGVVHGYLERQSADGPLRSTDEAIQLHHDIEAAMVDEMFPNREIRHRALYDHYRQRTTRRIPRETKKDLNNTILMYKQAKIDADREREEERRAKEEAERRAEEEKRAKEVAQREVARLSAARPSRDAPTQISCGTSSTRMHMQTSADEEMAGVDMQIQTDQELEQVEHMLMHANAEVQTSWDDDDEPMNTVDAGPVFVSPVRPPRLHATASYPTPESIPRRRVSPIFDASTPPSPSPSPAPGNPADVDDDFSMDTQPDTPSGNGSGEAWDQPCQSTACAASRDILAKRLEEFRVHCSKEHVLRTLLEQAEDKLKRLSGILFRTLTDSQAVLAE